MSSSTRLGGFKILKGVNRFSLALPVRGPGAPSGLFQALAAARINLPYIAMIRDGPTWCLNAMVEEVDAQRASQSIREAFGIFAAKSKCGILSLFPHRSDPGVLAKLLQVLAQEGIVPDTLANSPAAVSVGLKEAYLERAGQALFQPFSFSAYRTPADWRLAQKGKETLYREVVASYQEQRPKVYGLEVREGLVLRLLKLREARTDLLGRAFERLAALQIHLSFLSACTCGGQGLWAFCLPRDEGNPSQGFVEEIPAARPMDAQRPVAVFSMNGPHFGDRYGIAGELLGSLEARGIDLLGLSCTVASVTGVAPLSDLEALLAALQERFDVPAVTRKGVSPPPGCAAAPPADPFPESS